ncbi:hypothetical protein [Streptomyces sp. NPDC093261]
MIEAKPKAQMHVPEAVMRLLDELAKARVKVTGTRTRRSDAGNAP